MAQEVSADSLGDEWKGYVFRITGGNDKQGESRMSARQHWRPGLSGGLSGKLNVTIRLLCLPSVHLQVSP